MSQGLNTVTLNSYRSIYERMDESGVRELADCKRVIERFIGDRDFRESFRTDPAGLRAAQDALRVNIDINSLLPAFHPDFKGDINLTSDRWRLAARWAHYVKELISFRGDLLQNGDSGGYCFAYDKWRRRQIGRTSFDLGVAASGIVHPPVAFELSSGCSVGCWFCGISAMPFRGHYRGDAAGLEEWKRILLCVQQVIGPAIGSAFLYWATEPLDNPDYVSLLDMFYEVTGRYPQTTTAIPMRNPQLTREVIKRWERYKFTPNRFSILSVRSLRQVHDTFSPLDLLGVELVLQNPEALNATKTKAGRTRDRSIGRAQGEIKSHKISDGTIACVSGFLINIVERSIRLVSPCTPNERYPQGYITYETLNYQNVDQLGEQLQYLIGRWMSVELNARTPIRFSENMEFDSPVADGRLQSPSASVASPAVSMVGTLLLDKLKTPLDLLRDAVKADINPFLFLDSLNMVREAGLVEQLPVGEQWLA